MARLNITIPDALYARLEQLRDRINLSKVCANALEKEATMLEGQPNITDPRIAQLLQRLQSTRERWYRRGHDDGTQWAVETATREELWSVATKLAGQNGQQLAEMFRMQQQHMHIHSIRMQTPPPHAGAQPGIPFTQTLPSHVVHAEPLVARMHPPMTHQVVEGKFFSPVHPPFVFPASFPIAERLQAWENRDREMSGQAEKEGEASTRNEVDEAAYLEGWRDAIKGIWQAIAPAL